MHDVLHSDEPLHGPAGKYYQLQKMREEVVSPQELKTQIKMGRIAYRAGPLGGCTNPEPCKSAKGLRLIDITCATEGCRHLVGKHSKIIQAINLQRAAMRYLDPKSITYQVEKEDLEAMEATEVLWRSPDGSVAEAQAVKHV